MARHEGLAHLAPHLERSRPDGRPEPGHQAIRCDLQLGHSVFQDATRQPTPASMSRSHAMSIAIAEQHRQAIGGEHRTGEPRHIGPACISLRTISLTRRRHDRRMGLLEPSGLAAQCDMQTLPVGGNGQRIIPDDLLGRVNSAYRFFGWGMMALGAPLAALVITVVEPLAGRETALRAPYLLGASAYLLMVPLVLLRLRTVHLRAAEEAAERTAASEPAEEPTR